MTSGRLTKRMVDAFGANGLDHVRWDGELAGFGVRVRPNGTKTFIAQYRIGGRNSRVRKVTIGSYGKLTRKAFNSGSWHRGLTPHRDQGRCSGMPCGIRGQVAHRRKGRESCDEFGASTRT